MNTHYQVIFKKANTLFNINTLEGHYCIIGNFTNTPPFYTQFQAFPVLLHAIRADDSVLDSA